MYLFKLLFSLVWVPTSSRNCFGVKPGYSPPGTYDVNKVTKAFHQSILSSWYESIIMDGGRKLVHTFTIGERWFMVNLVYNHETSRFMVKTTVSGQPLNEEEERLLDFFEWYVGVTLTSSKDFVIEKWYHRPDVTTYRNENWCVSKNDIIIR